MDLMGGDLDVKGFFYMKGLELTERTDIYTSSDHAYVIISLFCHFDGLVLLSGRKGIAALDC